MPSKMPQLRLVDLRDSEESRLRDTAEMLVAGFREHHPAAWPTLEAALDEVRESLAPERVSRVALDDRGDVVGWIGAIPAYRGNVWEIHPLVVRPSSQRQGVGRALVEDLETLAGERGALTLLVGTDDENDQTTLSGVDLYPELWEHVRAIRNLGGHPYEFYLKLGFVIVGVIPDANGRGRPDVLMARRVSRP
ncbi:MAG: GNAT family N-acetyltransferase [Chloroflexota bacterium]